MRKFRSLLSLNFRAMLTTFRFGGRKSDRHATGAGALLLLAGLSLYLSGVYSFLFAAQLARVGQLSLLLPIMSLLAVVMGVLFSLFAAQGVVFGTRDNDLMLALPVSAFTLMLSRTLALYLENLVSVFFMLLPAGAAYLWHGGGGGVVFFLLLILSALFLALLPTLISLTVGYVLAVLSGKTARRALWANLFYLLFFLLLFWGLFRFNRILTQMGQAAGSIRTALSGWALPLLLMERGLCSGDALALLGFFALCLLPFLLVVRLFAMRYKQIVTRLSARSVRSDYRLERLSSAGPRRALLKREALRFFGTPVYLFNAGFGLLLLPVAGVAALFQRARLDALLAQVEAGGLTLPLTGLLAAGIWFVLSTAAVTASSISLEGNRLWILKEAPVGTATLFRIKAGFQLLLTLPCLLTGTALLSLALGLSWLDGLLVALSGIAFALFTAPFGLYVNLCFPKLDALSDAAVVKQSAASLIGVLVPMAVSLAGLLLQIALGGLVGESLLLLVCTAALLVCAALMERHLLRAGAARFQAL